MSLEKVILKHEKFDASAEVYLYGATITSWKVDGVDYIFVSEKAKLDGSKAIRGGVPVCFPQFGPWELGPQHGFARISTWSVDSPVEVDPSSGDATVSLALKDDETTRKSWPQAFKVIYKITLLQRALKIDVQVANGNETQELDFTFCLHTYFNVPDVTKCAVKGLKGLSYIDKTDGAKTKEETGDEVVITGFTDRVYLKSPDECVLSGLESGKSLKLAKTNMADTVVWNPWSENAKNMSDFGDEEYQRMICVEAVQTSERIPLKAGAKWEAQHTLTLMD